MKTIIVLLMLPFFAASQSINASIRIGMKTNPASPVLATGIDFKAYGFALSPELIIDAANSEPANFGLKLSYEHGIVDNVSIRAGAGLFYQLYTLDKYDAYRNGYAGNCFLSLHWKRWFGEIEYMDCVRLSIGVRETIF